MGSNPADDRVIVLPLLAIGLICVEGKVCDEVLTPDGRKGSGDSLLSDDCSLLPDTPSVIITPSGEFISEFEPPTIACTPSPNQSSLDVSRITSPISPIPSPDFDGTCSPNPFQGFKTEPYMRLCTRHPQFFDHDFEDTHYMDYFLTKVKVVLPYFEVFPNMVTDIFVRATSDQGLFHTVLSVSHLIADSRLHRSLMPAFHHQTQALALLQQSISETDITEALAISVAMLAWLNMTRCNRPAMNQHLNGLYLIFQEIRSHCQLLSPLMMQLWRFSIRLDVIATVLFFPRDPLFDTVSVDEDHLHRNWIALSTPTYHDTDWTLASFALDNLMHRATHIAMKAYKLRCSNPETAQRQIESWTQSLLSEHSQWSARSIIAQAQCLESKANENMGSTSDSYGNCFLDYPPLRVFNKFYGNLLNAWRAIYIFIDLIVTPEIGPLGRGSKRFEHAIDICRTYASLGKDDMFPIGKVTNVFLTGVALGGEKRSPREVEWLYEGMLKEIQEWFPLNRTAVVHPSTHSHVAVRVANGIEFLYESMGVGGELLGCNDEIECGITIRFSELHDLKIRNSDERGLWRRKV